MYLYQTDGGGVDTCKHQVRVDMHLYQLDVGGGVDTCKHQVKVDMHLYQIDGGGLIHASTRCRVDKGWYVPVPDRWGGGWYMQAPGEGWYAPVQDRWGGVDTCKHQVRVDKGW